jgi:endonuclease YncB( thermonuclease family)
MFEHDYKQYPELTNSQLSDFGFSSPHIQYAEDFDAVVVKVHDGDTVTLRTSDRGFDFPLRLLNIDAKELSEGGDEARDWLSARLTGESVRVLIDKSQRVGKYGRLLGRILHHGLDVAEEMLGLGMVWSFDNRKEGQIPSIHKFFQEGAIP